MKHTREEIEEAFDSFKDILRGQSPPTDVYNRDIQNSTIKIDGESKDDRELNAFLSVAGTQVPVARGFVCDCGCISDDEFEFDDDDFE